jgi:di/tricarboxylate transporter
MFADLISDLGPNFRMWATFAIIVVALVFYALEIMPMEVTSMAVVSVLILLFQAFPLTGADGRELLSPARLLEGFANPALITVLALLVIGQGMVGTGILDRGARFFLAAARGNPWMSIIIVLSAVIAVSAFLNNIPVVVIFIPIMQAIAGRFGSSPGKMMIPLSFAAVLGGMTTLVGSSTNLLVNSAMIEMGERPFEFFDFTIPGLIMAAGGLVYVIVIAPRLLPERDPMAATLTEGSGYHFIAQIAVSGESELIGQKAPGGHFASLAEMTVRVIQRGGEAILPPFEDYQAAAGDVLVVAATRKALTEALSHDPGLLYPDLQDDLVSLAEDEKQPWGTGERILVEVMVAPASRMIGRTLARIGFRYKTNCIVLGIQRRSHMFRSRITDIELRAGDVLLVQGQPEDVHKLKRNRDVVLIEWSAEELPALDHARLAGLIFLAFIFSAASGVVPIVAAALAGAVAMVITGVLNLNQTLRAIDVRIIATIGTALALGVTLDVTGGAAYIAGLLLAVLAGASKVTVLSLFFLMVALLSNIVSTKTAAVLFIPIAVDIARAIGAPVEAFAVAVVFAANCSFASPLGYQTNLLVMGPGHYRFFDYSRAGLPLIFVLWGVFSVVAPWYYGM